MQPERHLYVTTQGVMELEESEAEKWGLNDSHRLEPVDPLDPARGILTGVVLTAGIWIVLFWVLGVLGWR